jgi:hypothetical protein
MTDRFNFFDIFGYLLPGVLLIALGWLPFGLFMREWPAAELGSALVLVVLAYVLGHILQSLAAAVFPSKFPDPNGFDRHPSDLLLDSVYENALPGDNKIPNEVKQKIFEQVRDRFKLDLTSQDSKVSAEESKLQGTKWYQWGKRRDFRKNLKKIIAEQSARRNNAFRQCRSYLVQRKLAGYAEQQQAMYVLLRGVTAALFIASGLYFGWTVRFFLNVPTDGYIWCALISLFLAAVLMLFIPKTSRSERAFRNAAYFLVILVAVSSSASIQAHFHSDGSKTAAVSTPSRSALPRLEANLTEETNAITFEKKVKALERVYYADDIKQAGPLVMTALGLLSVFLAAVCRNSYHHFTIGFAAMVYRDFLTAVQEPVPGGSGDEGGEKVSAKKE